MYKHDNNVHSSELAISSLGSGKIYEGILFYRNLSQTSALMLVKRDLITTFERPLKA